MTTQIEGNCRTFVASAAISQFARVKLSSGQLAAAGADDVDIGTLDEAALAASDIRPVRLSSATGTRKMIAAGAIAVGALVYGAASGKVDDTGSGRFVGIALSASTADNDIIEVLYDPSLAGGKVQIFEESFVLADFTDNTDATGYADYTNPLPAGAQVLGWEANTTEGFTGDTTAVVQVGISGNVNLYSAFTNGSVLAAGKAGSPCQVSTDNPYQASAVTPRITVTGGADFTSIAAGAMTMRIAALVF